MVFNQKSTAILWAKLADSSEFLSLGGVNSDISTPDNAVTQANKLLAIFGKSISADKMCVIITKEAVDNG